MIAVNVSSPSNVVCGKCNVIVSFAHNIEQLHPSNIQLGGDTNGVDFNISGKGCCWTLAFSFDDDIKGELDISIIGEVIKLASGEQASLESATVTVKYNTCNRIRAIFGDPVYERGTVRVPVEFSQAVVGANKALFNAVLDDGLQIYKKQVVGDGTGRAFQLEMTPPSSYIGIIDIKICSNVRKDSGHLAVVEDGKYKILYPGQ